MFFHPKSLKRKMITHDMNHDLAFYCTHNQLCVSVFWVLGMYKFVLGMKSDFFADVFFCFLIATLGIRIFLTVIKGGRVYLFLSIYNCNNALIYFESDILDLKTNMRSPSRYCTIISGGVITWLMVGLTYGLFLGCSSSGWPACKFCCLNKSYFHFALIKSTWSNLQKSDLSPRQSLLNTLESKINLDLCRFIIFWNFFQGHGLITLQYVDQIKWSQDWWLLYPNFV